MKRTRTLALLAGLVLLGWVNISEIPAARASQVALADEKPKGEPVEIDKLSKAVVDAVQKILPGAHFGKALKLDDGNFLLTDVKFGKKEYNVTVTPEGKVVNKEEDND